MKLGHDKIWNFEKQPRQDMKVSRLRQDRGMQNYVLKQSWDETSFSRLRHQTTEGNLQHQLIVHVLTVWLKYEPA